MGYTLVAFLVYLVLMLGIGIISARSYTHNSTDFYLGGRQMNSWVVALSAVASGRSAWLMLGLVGIAYAKGLSAIWAVVGYILVELWQFAFLGKRLRYYSQNKDVLTIPGYLEERLEDKSHKICLTTTLVISFFFLFYIAAQLLAGGIILSQTFGESLGISQTFGILITAVIILIYTSLGGYVAVALTDVIQATFMILSLVVLPIYAVMQIGGLGVILEKVANTPLEAYPLIAGAAMDPWLLGIGGVVGYISIGLGSPGNPHILVRYMSIQDAQMLRKCALVGTLWNVVMAWGAIIAGLAARAYFPDVSFLPLKNEQPNYDKVFVELAQVFFHPALLGFVLASVFAAIMSTVDSQLLVISSSITQDFYKRIFQGKASEKSMLMMGRISVGAILMIAILLSIYAYKSIFWLVLLAWAGLGASLGPAIVLSLYWKRTTAWGVLAGVLTGGSIIVLWEFVPWLGKNIIGYGLLPAFSLATLAIVVCSLLTSAPEKVEEHFQAMKE